MVSENRNALITRYGNDSKELRQARQIEYTQRVLETECKDRGSNLDTVHTLEHFFTELEKLECGLPDSFKRNYLMIRLKDTAPEIYTSVAQDIEMKYDTMVHNVKRLAALNSAIDETKSNGTEGCHMKGFMTKDRNICEYCGKKGHNDAECWAKHPDKSPMNTKSRDNRLTCYKCGQKGHMKRNCRNNGSKKNIFATLNKNKSSIIDCYLTTYVDSASSCHTVNSLKLLDEGTIRKANESVTAVDGTTVPLKLEEKYEITTLTLTLVLTIVLTLTLIQTFERQSAQKTKEYPTSINFCTPNPKYLLLFGGPCG